MSGIRIGTSSAVSCGGTITSPGNGSRGGLPTCGKFSAGNEYPPRMVLLP